MSHDEGLNGATALGERRPAARHRMERQDRVHGRVEGRGPRSPQGREVEHRRRWPEICTVTGANTGPFWCIRSIPIAIGRRSYELEVSAPRGSFTLRSGGEPVV